MCILKNNQSESKAKKQSLTWGNKKSQEKRPPRAGAGARAIYNNIQKRERKSFAAHARHRVLAASLD